MTPITGIGKDRLGFWHAYCRACEYMSKAMPDRGRANRALKGHMCGNAHRRAARKAAAA